MLIVFTQHQLQILPFLSLFLHLDHSLLVHLILESVDNCLFLIKLLSFLVSLSSFLLLQLIISRFLLSLDLVLQLIFSFNFFFLKEFLMFGGKGVIKSVFIVFSSFTNIFLSYLSIQLFFNQSFSLFFS